MYDSIKQGVKSPKTQTPTMQIQPNYNTRSAGCLEVTATRDGDTGVNAPPAAMGLRPSSLNSLPMADHENSSSLGPNMGSRPQDQNTRAPSVSVPEELATPEVPQNPPHVNLPNVQSQSKKIGLKIGSLNVRGQRYPDKSSKYKDIASLVRRNRILILAIQETKLKDNNELQLMAANPKIFIESNPGINGAGVAFIINKELLGWDESKAPVWKHQVIIPGRVSRLKVEWDDQCIDIINIYTPNDLKPKVEFLTELKTKLEEINDLYEPILIGDFNFVMDAIDRLPHRRDDNKVVEAWKAIEQEYKLNDGWRSTHEEEKCYSFNQKNSFSRIDRIYVNEELYRYTYDWRIQTGAGISDHQLTTVNIMKKGLPYIGRGIWKLDIDTIEWIPFSNRIRKALLNIEENMSKAETNVESVTKQWLEGKKEIKQIGIKEATNRKRQMLNEQLKKQRKLRKTFNKPKKGDHVKRCLAAKITRDLENMEKEKMDNAQLSAKARFKTEGERGTKYFFGINKKKLGPSVIMALQNHNGTLIRDTTSMSKIASEHHKNLQAAPEREEGDMEHIEQFLENITVELSDSDQNLMGEKTNVEEVLGALRKSKNGVSAGIDGLPYEFYKHWNRKYEEYQNRSDKNDKEIKPTANIISMITTVFNEIETTGLDQPDFILGAMHLLYKKNDKTKIENYRPITLTNSDYKLYTKTIATKLGNVASKIIHHNQAGFIPGRGLYDHTRLTEAMIEYCDIFEEDGYIMALDQEKAYDKIAHDYLWKVLEKFKFPKEFIYKIQQLYKGARTIVMVNGTLPAGIDILRGVRQGCPMSCLLYDIAIEPLAAAIRNSELEGFEIPGVTEKILASLFADDTLIYMKKDDDMKILQNIIDDFCKTSTAKFNMNKTEILPMGTQQYRKQVYLTRKVNDSQEEEIPTYIRIVKDQEALRTLGAFVGNKTNQYPQWELILKKQKEILDQWSRMNLSFRGKELILKALIQSRALFLAAVNGMPKDIQDKMEKQMKEFLWEKKRATMIWQDVTQPREKGGLGMPDIKARIEAIQLMWLKKFLAPTSEKPTWAFVAEQIIQKYPQKSPVVDMKSKMNWALQSWNESEAKDSKIPPFIKTMLRTGRKYNVGYDALVVGEKVQNNLPIWYHLGILDNYSWNKKGALCLREKHHIETVKHLTEFANTTQKRTKKNHKSCIAIANKILDKLPAKMDPRTNTLQDSLDHTPKRVKQWKNANPEDGKVLLDPRTVENLTPEKSFRLFGTYNRSKKRGGQQNNLTGSPVRRNLPTISEETTVYTAYTRNDICDNNEPFVIGWITKDDDDIEETNVHKVNGMITRQEIEALTIAKALEQPGDIIIKTDMTTVTTNVCKNLKTWEDEGFYNRTDGNAWKEMLYKLRSHPGKVHIDGALTDEDLHRIRDLKTKLKENHDTVVQPTPYNEIPQAFKLEGARLMNLTQKMAYTLILANRNITPGTDITRSNIKRTQTAHHVKTGRIPLEHEIWSSINKDPIPMKFRDFIWKLIHNRHKVGRWFLKIPEWEEKAQCECGELESMEYIIFKCKLNNEKTIWEQAEKLWTTTTKVTKWIKPNIDLIMSLGAIRLKHSHNIKDQAPRWLNEKYIEIVSETAWIIWKMRNDRVFNDVKLESSRAQDKWQCTITEKLKTDWRSIARTRDYKQKTQKTKLYMQKWAENKQTIKVSKNKDNVSVDLNG